jgi:hypothetical protein
MSNQYLADYVSLIAGSGAGCITVSSCRDENLKALGSKHFPATDISSVVQELEQTPINGQAFLNVCRMDSPPTTGRGRFDDMTYLSVIGMDIDVFDTSKPEKNLPKTIQEAISLLEGFGTPPAMVVQSGTGLHAYFPLEQELVLTDSEQRKEAAKVVADFYRGFAEYAKPFTFDQTKDIARMLRAPGTMNLKDVNNPIKVEVLTYDESRKYSLDEIQSVSSEKHSRAWAATTSDDSQESQGSLNFAKIQQGCAWVKQAMASSRTATHDEWFAMASIMALCTDGRELFHEYSKGHPDYDPDECNAKFDQVDPDKAARTCDALNATGRLSGICDTCPFRGGLKSPTTLGKSGRCSVITTNKYLPEKTAELLVGVHVFNDPETIFTTPMGLARVDTKNACIEKLDLQAAKHQLARMVTWQRVTQNGLQPTNPEEAVVQDLLAHPKPPLPVLNGVRTTPLITKDGRIVSEQGYDQETGIYVLRREKDRFPLNVEANQDDAKKAVKRITEDILIDFPFADQSSKANALALMVQPIMRSLFSGPTPIYLIDKPIAGSGATMLATVCAWPYLNDSLPMKIWTNREDERRKQITSHLMTGQEFYMWDNISGFVESDSVASVTTSTTFSDRLLGGNKVVNLKNETTWIASGNNPGFSGQMSRRMARIRLQPETDTPALREGFKHPNLVEYVAKERRYLAMAVYNIVIAWVNAGMPDFSGKALGSFEDWSRTIGGALEYAGVEGFLSNTEMQMAAIDDETARQRELVAAWWAGSNGNEAAPSAILPWVMDTEIVDDWSHKNDRGQASKLGKYLSSLVGRVFTVEVQGEKLGVQIHKSGARNYVLKRK